MRMYKDFGYSKGLIRRGHIDSGVEALSVPGSLEVTIDLVSPLLREQAFRSRPERPRRPAAR
jgi:hypothetical protein